MRSEAAMIAPRVARALCAASVAWFVFASDARAQQPSAAAVALAKEVVELKGAITMFDAVVVGVIEHNKNLLLQVNPNLSRDINDVGTQLRNEYAGRRAEIHTEIARAYASQFTEQELRDAATFFKSPLGKKIIEAEPKALDEATRRVDAWSGKFAEEVMVKMRAEMRKKGHNLL
jgi:hypothetical protein